MTQGSQPAGPSAGRLVAIVCAAQVMVQIGAFFWPALLPQLMPLWGLTNSEAGWITAAFYGAYMAAVPVLVTLTDRIDPKRVYLFGVATTVIGHGLFAWVADGFWSALAMRALTGIGWAGTYMTGLKLLADRVDAKAMSRAVTGHAASIGISGALSFLCADLIAAAAGWRMAFAVASVSALVAWIAVATRVPGAGPPPRKAGDTKGLYDFRPVLRNRSAMAYALAYGVHTLEMSALRGWAVAFLGYVAVSTGQKDPWLSPAMVVTVLGLIGTFASVIGNEAAIRFGRRRLIVLAMSASAILAASLGQLGTMSYAIAVSLLMFYGLIVWLDSSSLTAGAAGTAEPSRRGQTLAVHSMLGYSGGFIGPLIIGWALDWWGGMSPAGWTAGFASVAVLMVAAMGVFIWIRPGELAGDRSTATAPAQSVPPPR